MSSIELVRVEDGVLIVSVRVGKCSNCKNPIIHAYSMVPYDWKTQLAKQDVRIESTFEDGLCTVCVKEGGFDRACDICDTKHVFPQEFAYTLRFNPEFRDGDGWVEHVCNWCIEYSGKSVIKRMGEAAEIREIKDE